MRAWGIRFGHLAWTAASGFSRLSQLPRQPASEDARELEVRFGGPAWTVASGFSRLSPLRRNPASARARARYAPGVVS
jgi:hypothetical protein